MRPAANCPHGPAVPPPARAAACEECGEESSLRICTECGHVGCCDSSNRHARAHAADTGHARIRALPLTERSFLWCYECDDYLRP